MRNRFTLILVAFFSFSSIACECPIVADLTKAECGKFDVIVRGKVEQVNACKNGSLSTIFYVSDLYRGEVNTKLIEFFSDCESNCAMSFNKGEEWLLFLKKSDGKLQVNICDRNRKKIDDASQDFYASVLQSTFDEDCIFLKENVGFTELKEQNNSEENKRYTDITKRENKWSNRWNTVILLCVSLVGFTIIYYLFKKFVK